MLGVTFARPELEMVPNTLWDHLHQSLKSLTLPPKEVLTLLMALTLAVYLLIYIYFSLCS